MTKLLRLTVLSMASIFLITACTNNKPQNEPEQNSDAPVTTPEETPGDNIPDKDEPSENSGEEVDISLFGLFLPDGTHAHYKGDGNEFAELDIEVTKIDDTYVIIDENNGGVLLRTVYGIQDDRIVTLSEEPIDLDEPLPSMDDLAQLEPIEIYFQQPVEEGSTFGDWTIVETTATVETPYKTFDNAIVVVEMKDEGFINRKYFVTNYGEVKRESIMKADGNGEQDFIVTSTLESIE